MSELAPKKDADIPDVFGGVKDTAEGLGGTGEMATRWVEQARGLEPGSLGMPNNLVQGAGVIAGMADVGGGVQDIANGNYVDGAIKTGSGLAGTAKSGAELMGYGQNVVDKLNYVGAGFDGLSAVNNFAKGDIANGLKDGTSSVLGFVAPQLVAPWKLGWQVGTGLDQQAAKDNLFGGHRTASKHAGEHGADVRQNLEALGANQQDAFIGGGVATLGQSVTNTIDTALNTIAMPPIVRQLGAEAGGDGANPMSVSIMDVVGLGGLDRATREAVQPQGPSIYDIVGQSVAYVNALKAQIEAQQQQAQPFTGMY